MSCLGRVFAILLVTFLAVSSLIMAESVEAQTPTPSVPEFTIRYVEYPFDVAPTYRIDQYSGQNITIQEGYRQQNRSIELSIKNQPFTSFKDSHGNQIILFFNVSSKGNFGNTWHYYPTWMRTLPVTASDKQYTVLSFGLDVNYEKDNQYGFWYGDLSTGDRVDFRVQALIGYYSYPLYNVALEYNTFTGEVSGWSNTQTITISEGSLSTSTPNPSSNPTATPTPTNTSPVDNNITSQITSLALATIAILVIIVISLVLYVRHLKRSTAKPDNSVI